MARDYFQELLAKYRNIQYPSTSQRQFDTLRNDLRREILTPQFEQARMEYQNMLAGTGVNRRSVDATEGGEQQQIIINPTTGATEIVTPEYNRQFRTDNLDFNPGGGGIFENIYDVDEGRIDPRTGRPKDEEIVEDTNTGLISDTGGRGEGRDKDQGAGMQYSHEIINGVAYRIDNETGAVEMLDGLDATIANVLSGYVNNFTIGGILNGKETYQEKLDRIRNISEDAYNEITLNVREQARVDPNFDSEEESFLDKVKNFFGRDTDKDPDSTGPTGPGIGGFTEADANRESFRDPNNAGNNNNNNNNTDAGVNSGAGGTGGSGATNGGSSTSGGGSPDGEGGAGGTGGSGASNGGASNGGSSGGCFVEGTLIQMADGTTKEITTIKLGEKIKGGIVEAKMQFLPQNIYNYKDVLVSGSHWVVEDNQLIAVEDSKHGVLTDRIEPVYTFKTSNNRIWINDIEFGDFETGSDTDWEPHFEMVRQKLNKELRDGK